MTGSYKRNPRYSQATSKVNWSQLHDKLRFQIDIERSRPIEIPEVEEIKLYKIERKNKYDWVYTTKSPMYSPIGPDVIITSNIEKTLDEYPTGTIKGKQKELTLIDLMLKENQ